MTEFLRSWILGILTAALFLGVLEAIMPPGPVRQVGKLAAGLVLFLAVVAPLLEAAPGWLMSGWTEQVEAASAYPDDLEAANESYLETIMSQRAAEYIVTQAESLGLSVSAEVECVWEDSLPLPAAAAVTGQVSETDRETLSGIIRSELGIEAEQITFLSPEEEP